MPNGIKILDATNKTILDTSTITFSLLGTIYCAANGTATATFNTNGLAVSTQVYVTDTFPVTIAPTLATVTTTVSGTSTTCSLAGGNVGCTALVFIA